VRSDDNEYDDTDPDNGSATDENNDGERIPMLVTIMMSTIVLVAMVMIMVLMR